MKLISKLFILFLATNFCWGQNNTYLPNITPPSPEAYSMTKYGDLNLNGNKGFINQNIPLYEYEAGKLKLPISINYQGAGVKIDDIPSWVGINWTLNAGGLVTRIVKDIPDEKSSDRIFLTDQEINHYTINTLDGTPEAAFIKKICTQPQYDTEADIFNFNFGEYSGSFFLDENLIPRIQNCKNQLKIEISQGFLETKEIKITTPDGIVYNFGGVNATEETMRRYIVDGSPRPNDTHDGTTAFYLTSIKHPLRGIVFFEYNELGIKNVVSQKIQKKSVLIDESQDITNGVCMLTEGESNSLTMITRIFNPKYLTRIYSPHSDYEVLFQSSPSNSSHFSRILKKIIVQKTTPNYLIRSIDFKYLGENSPDRFFLERIIIDKELDQVGSDYFFKYNTPLDLPERFSYAQDYSGYYNGIVNNPNAIPDNELINPNNVPNSFANRTPNFEFASKGTLTHIYYPTKGYTFYEYEPTKAKHYNSKRIDFSVYRNMNNLIPINKLTDGIPRMLPNDEVEKIENVYQEQTVKFIATLKATGYNSSISPRNEKVILKITDISIPNSLPSVYELAMDPPNASEYQGIQTHTKQIVIEYLFKKQHNYNIQLIINTNNGIATSIPFEAKVYVEYYDGVQIVDNNGVRVKKITNYSDNNNPESIRRFYYKSIKDYINGTENLNFINTIQPVITENRFINGPCPKRSGDSEGVFEAYQLITTVSSEKINLSDIENLGTYPVICTSFGGDNFEQGGIEKEFRKNNNYGILKIPMKKGIALSYTPLGLSFQQEWNDNSSISNPLNGDLVRETYLIKDKTTLKVEKEVFYNYEIKLIKKINNLTSRKLFNTLFHTNIITQANTVHNYYVGTYLTESFRNELEKKTEINYITPISINFQSQNPTLKIVNETNYIYNDSLIGFPREIVSISSKGETKITKNLYPIENDLNNLNHISTIHLNGYNLLKNKNIISTPFQTETYIDGALTSRNRVLYKDWGNGMVMPEIIQSSKGNLDLEDRVIYESYQGTSPSIVSLKNGPKTKYVYNSNNQVVIKIENYTSGTQGDFNDEELNQNNTENYNPCASSTPLINRGTLYIYDNITRLLKQIKDFRCRNTFYYYDPLHRLKRIVDHNNNKIEEFKYNYRPQ